MALSRVCRTALVTGASGGVGSVLVERLEREGMRIAAVVRDVPSARTPGRSVLFFDGDVTDETSVRELFANASREMGSLDLVVNTVGGYLPATNLDALEAQAWDRMMAINLRSTFLCTREAIRAMKAQGHGVIVNFSALAGLNPTPGRIAYAVAKSGVALLTRMAAEELRGSGITVYAIAPGIIATEANRSWGGEEAQARWVTPEAIAEKILSLAQGTTSADGTVITMGTLT